MQSPVDEARYVRRCPRCPAHPPYMPNTLQCLECGELRSLRVVRLEWKDTVADELIQDALDLEFHSDRSDKWIEAVVVNHAGTLSVSSTNVRGSIPGISADNAKERLIEALRKQGIDAI